MHFTANRREFHDTLAVASSIADRRHTQPLVACVLLAASGTELAVTATNLQIESRSTLALEDSDEAENGIIAARAKDLYDIVSALDGKLVTIQTDGDGWIKIVSGRARYRVPTLKAIEFPLMKRGAEEPSGVEIPASELERLIGATITAASTDYTRPHICAIALSLDKAGLSAIATDGHRLVICTRPITAEYGISGEAAAALDGLYLNRDTCHAIQRLIDVTEAPVCAVASDQTHVFVRSGDSQITAVLGSAGLNVASRRSAAKLSSPDAPAAVVSRVALIAALKRVQLMAGGTLSAMKICIDERGMGVSSVTVEKGEAEETLDVDVEPGQTITVAANPRYIADILDVMRSERVRVRNTGALEPIELSGEPGTDIRAVVMPCRV